MIRKRSLDIWFLGSLVVLASIAFAFMLSNAAKPPAQGQPPPPASEQPPLPIRTPVLREGNIWLLTDIVGGQAQVTSEGNVVHVFGLSPDGQRILYGVGARPVRPATEDIGGTDLWVINTDGTDAHQLTADLQVISAVWSSIGQRIAYTTRDFQLLIIGADGSGQTLVSNTASLVPSSWSPDDRWLAYVAYPDDWDRNFLNPDNPLNVFLFEVASGQRRQLTFDGSRVINADPQWSLDGSKLIFQTGEPNGVVPYWRSINMDGSGLQILEDSKVVGSWMAPVVRSPTRDEIAFSGGGIWTGEVFRGRIWVMDFSGNARLLVEMEWEGPRHIVWLPEGVGLAWGNALGGETFIVSLPDGQVQPLIRDSMTLPSAYYEAKT